MPFTSRSAFSAEALLERAEARLRAEPVFVSFMTQIAAELERDDIEDISAATLVDGLEAFWDWAQTAPPRAVRLRRLEARDPTRDRARLVLETTGPDIPFLVDSLQGELAAQGVDVLATLHPIVVTAQGMVSHIQIHLPLLHPMEEERVLAGARQTLSDVSVAVADYPAMRARMFAEAERIATLDHLSAADREEAHAFLTWLAEDHFVFLGSRRLVFRRDAQGEFLPEEPDMIDEANLGILRDTTRNVLNAGSEPVVLTPEIGAFLREPSPVVMAKSDLMCWMHRRVLADYVGVKHYDQAGRVVGETRFAGLFAAEAYTESTHYVPMLRRKVANVTARAGMVPGTHNAKALANILENYPRDELFQIGEDELLETALAILQLQGRPRPGVFLRHDRFGRSVSALTFVPRESYDAALRVRIGEAIREAYDGTLTAFYPRFGDDRLARVLYHVALKPGAARPDPAEVRARVAGLARSWEDRFRVALDARGLEPAAREAALAFRSAFNAAYREAFSPEEAILDVAGFEAVSAAVPVRMRTYRPEGANAGVIGAKVYARGDALPLSRCVPVMENLGLFVAFETGYPARPNDLRVEGAADTYWVHAFTLSAQDGGEIDLASVGPALEDAFVAVWLGRTENDAFNRLIRAVGADWHEAALFRALSRYRRQTGLDPAEDVQVRALVSHAGITRDLLALFHARFDPATGLSLEARRAEAAQINARIEDALRNVAALDEDRALRRIAGLINAVVRTNFYHRDEHGLSPAHISFKLDAKAVDPLPDPVPYREIFMSSPRVEGVHLRFGPVARGGLRWSDRRDDYRTEVLGLVKAQQVKNAVIVPVGAKGGFFPKQLPPASDRDAWLAEGTAAYQVFVRSLLELTDKIVDGRTVHPADTVVWDGEDPYLVVAADKGTASFSDIANRISADMGHWLGDAFASGGSVGYDHKKMAITARGGWEAVKRHFREIGKDIQTEPFTVIGVGDMSGDVFGNGMLLSRKIRLLAAFDHRDIFIDPDPADLEVSFAERQRLFNLQRSSWQDYSRELISAGGGVFSRRAKSIPLNDAIRALTGLSGEAATPEELMAALLRAPCELLWFGGIGTYVKAPHETHAQVGDKANDAVRADAHELRAQVIGEGANLGMTQAGRIAFAQRGGRLNTDAIDNSAGVDSSDHEVNIKILLSGAIEAGELRAEDRDALLREMTDDVAAHVLAHNISQTAALSLAQASARDDHEALERLMLALEARGMLNRRVEGLPTSVQMKERADAAQPLTRPELSVLLAWSKITLFDDLVASGVPDDPWLAGTLRDYFPKALHGFTRAQAGHRLRREIIATVLANATLDRLGPAAFQRLHESSGAGRAELVRAITIAGQLLQIAPLEAAISALDNKVPAQNQTAMRLEIANAVFQFALRLAQDRAGEEITRVIERYGAAYGSFRAHPEALSTPFATARRAARTQALTRTGVPAALAGEIMALRPLIQGVHVVHLSEETGRPLGVCAAVFTGAGDALALDRLRVEADEALAGMAFWDRVATRRFIADLMSQQMRLARAVLATAPAGLTDGASVLARWMEPREGERAALLDGVRAKGEGGWSFAKFALVADDVRRFMDTGGGG